MQNTEELDYHFLRYTTDEMIRGAMIPTGPWDSYSFNLYGGEYQSLCAEERFFVFQLLRFTINQRPEEPILRWSVRVLAKRCYSNITVVSSTLKKLARFIETVEQPTKPGGYIFRENKQFAQYFFTNLPKRSGLLPGYKRRMQDELLKPQRLFVDSSDGRVLMTRPQRWLLSILLEFSESNGYVCFRDVGKLHDLAGMTPVGFSKVSDELIKYKLIETTITSPSKNYAMLTDNVIIQLNLSNPLYRKNGLCFLTEIFYDMIDIDSFKKNILHIQEKLTVLPNDYIPDLDLHLYVVKLLHIASDCLNERYRIRAFPSLTPMNNDPVSIARRSLEVGLSSAYPGVETALADCFGRHVEAIINNPRLLEWLRGSSPVYRCFSLHTTGIDSLRSFVNYKGAVVVKSYQLPK